MKDPIQWLPRPALLPKECPQDKQRLEFVNQPFLRKVSFHVVMRIRWAGFCAAVAAGGLLYAICILIFGPPHAKDNSMDRFLEDWLKSRRLNGWHCSDLKLSDNSRLDAVSAISRNEKYFLQFTQPGTGRRLTFGLGPEGEVARYDTIQDDMDIEVFIFREEVANCTSEKDLEILLDGLLEERLAPK